MQNAKRKIIVEFSMCEPEKAMLDACIQKNLAALNSNDPKIHGPAMDDLKATLAKTLPVDSLPELAKTLTSDSEYGWLIHNLPENKTFDFANGEPRRRPYASQVYSHHIGKALYEMHNVSPAALAPAVRRNPNHKDFNANEVILYTGAFIHRDFAAVSTLDSITPSDFAAFSSPYNAEDAPTSLFFVEDAIRNIPMDIRLRTEALVEFRQIESYEEGVIKRIMNLQEILENLENPQIRKKETISVIEARNEADKRLHNRLEDVQLFNNEIDNVLSKTTIGPGDLLIFCEDRIFHQGHPGDPDKLKLIPPENLYSRSFYHHAGVSRV